MNARLLVNILNFLNKGELVIDLIKFYTNYCRNFMKKMNADY